MYNQLPGTWILPDFKFPWIISQTEAKFWNIEIASMEPVQLDSFIVALLFN